MNAYERKMELQTKLNALDDRFGREDREQLISDYNAVLQTQAGRRLISSICGKEAVFGFVFYKSEGDPVKLAYQTGRRECAADVYSKANQAAPDMVLKMFEERNAVERSRYAQKKKIVDEISQLKEGE